MEKFSIYRIDNNGADKTCILSGEFKDNLSIYEHIVVANKMQNYTEDCYTAEIDKELIKPEKNYYYVFNADNEVMIQPMDIKDGKPVIEDKNPTATYNEKEVEEILSKFHKSNIVVTVEDGKTESWIKQERRLIETKKWHESEKTDKSLQEHLGLTDEEYDKFLGCTASFKTSKENFGDKKETSKEFNDLSFNVMSDICDEIISTLKKKNDDYGNSYIKNIERFGKQAMLIPMFNKLDRLESLSKKENQNFESFEDSLRDLMGYCLMATQHLIKTRGK